LFREAEEALFDIFEREAESSDYLEGFQICHSISGGTGSGMGSHALEKISDRFPKKLVHTYSVFPAMQKEASDVIVQPYNSILTVARLIEHPNSVVVLDNAALHRISSENAPSKSTSSFDHINSMVSRIMCAATATLRFPGPMYTRLIHLITALVAFPPMRFIQTGLSPLREGEAAVLKTSVNDTLRRLLQSRSLMSSAGMEKGVDHCLLSGLALLQGEIDPKEIFAAIVKLKERQDVKLVLFFPFYIHLEAGC
uniref:Tubulin gamma chain n=1 Tax=Gongylonema pulchrum TaxID=637853 RepID=A0A183ETT6_9BILA